MAVKKQQELSDMLAGLALFADMSHPQIEAASHTCNELSFSAGQRVLRQGFSHPDFYIIIEGEAAVHIDGEERSRLQRGDFFGEVAALLGEPATADVVAVTMLRCMTLPGADLQRFLTSFPALMYRILQAEARRLRQTIEWRT